MEKAGCSPHVRLKLILMLTFMPLLLWGCAAGRGPISTGGGLPEPEVVSHKDPAAHGDDSRLLASHNLTRQGYRLLEKGDADGALRVLEQAVGINPTDGSGYYYLAEAWIQKKNYTLASRFNRLALIYLRNDRLWSARAEAQKQRIEKKNTPQQ